MKFFSKSNKLILIATFLIIAVQTIVNTTSVMAVPTPGSTSQNGSIFYNNGPGSDPDAWTTSVGNTLPAYFTSPANAAPHAQQQSHYLISFGFDFHVPSNATITGIVAKVERKTDAMSIKDANIHLIKGGAIKTDTNPSAMPDTGLTPCPISIIGDC